MNKSIKILRFIPNGVFEGWDSDYSPEPEVCRLMDKHHRYHIWFIFERADLVRSRHDVRFCGHISSFQYFNIARLKVGDVLSLDDLNDYVSEYEVKFPDFCFLDDEEHETYLY